MRHGLAINQMSQTSGFLDQKHGLESLLKRGRPCIHKERNASWLGMVGIKNGYKLFETSTLNTFVERSVQFEEEPIPDFELAPGKCFFPKLFDDVSDD